MYKKVFLILCTVILLGAVVSCVIDDDSHGTGELTLYNDTSLPISEFYLIPVSNPSWGPNRLRSPLPSGSNYTLTRIDPDIYDVQAVITGELSIYYGYIFDISIVRWHTYNLYAYNSDFSGSLKIVNNTAASYIEGIYISPIGSGSWGPNQITSSIGPGFSMHFYDLPADSYDVRIVWDTPPDSFYYSNIISSLTLLTLYVN